MQIVVQKPVGETPMMYHTKKIKGNNVEMTLWSYLKLEVGDILDYDSNVKHVIKITEIVTNRDHNGFATSPDRRKNSHWTIKGTVMPRDLLLEADKLQVA